MRNIVLILLLAPGLLLAGWSAAKESELAAQAKKEQKVLLTARPSFHWPFNEATRAALMRLEGETIPLFAYGSLINVESASKTLSPATLETMRPAIAALLQP